MLGALIVLLVLGLLAAGLFFYGVGLYNGLVGLKTGVAQAWANIDVLLKQRHDELAKLVEVARQHLQFERDTLERVVAARNRSVAAAASGSPAAVGAAQAAITASLGRLVATVEAYPELRASQSLQHVLHRVTGLEEAIADRREFYNQAATLNNTRIAQFPDVFAARLFAFGPAELLRFAPAETQDVDMGSLFAGPGRGSAPPSAPAPGPGPGAGLGGSGSGGTP